MLRLRVRGDRASTIHYRLLLLELVFCIGGRRPSKGGNMNGKKSRAVPLLLAVWLSAVLLGACGSTRDATNQPASGSVVSGAAAAGINDCTGCHSVQTADWLTSKHANAVNGLNSPGSPTLAQVTGSCIPCHDPNSDSARIIAAGYIGSVARPVVGCEACHGGGSLHNGFGPISRLSGTYDSTTTYSYGTGTVAVSGQFLMCTNCHQLLDSTGTTTNPNPAHLATAPTGSANSGGTSSVPAGSRWTTRISGDRRHRVRRRVSSAAGRQ